MIINDQKVEIIFSNNPTNINYSQYGISNAILIDNTGIWRDRKSLAQHLSQTITNVILTAPGKNIPNIVYGVNNIPKDNILSAASCTTNAIVPIIKLINDNFKIKSGHIETVDSYTNDQNLLENYHKKWRRGRAAAYNIVLTETGAGDAINKCLPEIKNKFTANAIRVPTPNVSIAILILNVNSDITKEIINNIIKQESTYGKLFKQIEYYKFPDGVSSDFIGNKHTSIIDSYATKVKNNQCNLYVWYDNEFSYSAQVLRLADYLCRS